MNSIKFPSLDRTTQNLVISSTSNDLSNWSTFDIDFFIKDRVYEGCGHFRPVPICLESAQVCLDLTHPFASINIPNYSYEQSLDFLQKYYKYLDIRLWVMIEFMVWDDRINHYKVLQLNVYVKFPLIFHLKTWWNFVDINTIVKYQELNHEYNHKKSRIKSKYYDAWK